MNGRPTITFALAKGKLFDGAVALLQQAGIISDPALFRSRRLYFEENTYRFLLIKNTDVPTYVEYGIADAGIVGSDVITESGAEVYSPLDLRFGRCQLVVAGRPDDATQGYVLTSQLRVATKFPRTARDYFNRQGAQVEIVKLDGSVELAVVVGLADRIVDLVQTGETLRQNGMTVHETITESSARLIVNKASHALKLQEIGSLIKKLRSAIDENA